MNFYFGGEFSGFAEAQFQWPGEGQPHGGRALGLLPHRHRALPLQLCDLIGWVLPAGGAVGIKGLWAWHSYPEGLRRWLLGCGCLWAAVMAQSTVWTWPGSLCLVGMAAEAQLEARQRM